MARWKYEVTLHQFPETPCDEIEVIECDQTGGCFVHDACRVGTGWLEDLFHEKGNDGWELVQSGYHHHKLLCIWKKEVKD
jgi:hypothetical protein